MRSPRPFAAQDGTELLSTEAWYTLNKLPGLRRAGQRRALRARGRHPDRRREVRHRARRLHRHRLRVRHPDRRRVVGEGRRQRGQGRRLPDGAALRQRPEPVPGPEEDDADRQRHEPPDHAAVDRHVEDVGLLPRHGRAQRRARTRSSSSTTRATTATSTSTTLRLAPAGTTRYEAEAATLAGGANAQTEHAGYSGLGYVGGYQNQGASTTFKVNALADGAADVTLGYVNGPNPFQGTKRVSLYVNGAFVKKLALPGHGRVDRTTGRSPTSSSLQAPAATTSRSASTRATTATSTSTTSTSSRTSRSSAGPSTPNDTFDGATLDKCRWTTILNEDPAGYSVSRRQAADQGGRAATSPAAR